MRRICCSAALLVLLAAAPTHAAEVKIFRGDQKAAIEKGTLDGVSVDGEGALELARRVTRLASIEEPFVFSAAGHPKGWVVGTGSAGKVLLLDAVGGVEELAALPESQVFAVAVEPDGAVLAGTSPDGKLYRLGGGSNEDSEPEVIFDPDDLYIWDIDQDSEGRLLVATGSPGRLYRVDTRGDETVYEVLYESPDGHVRTLEPLDDGSILLGTAGQGLILRLTVGATRRGVTEVEVETVHDALHPEVLAFSETDDGRVYAAVLASEASLVDLSAAPKASSGGAEAVTVTEGDLGTVGSRGSGFKGARGLVLEIAADGTVRTVARFADETVHDLLWFEDTLWIGTGQEGRIYRLTDEGPVEERKLEESQVAALALGGEGAAAVAANASALYRLDNDPVAKGTYTSAVLDAGGEAHFGGFAWQGDLPKGTDVELTFRSGLSDTPDATWTNWQSFPCAKDAPCASVAGRRYETPLADLGRGRYVQWRAVLSGEGRSPRLEVSELSYRQVNRRPEITKLEVLDPGEILVPSGFNPQNQTFEPWSPNKEGIFTSLVAEKERDDALLKTLWKKGYQTLRWTATDPNGDDLVYQLQVQPESGWSGGDGVEGDGDGWLPVVEELDGSHYGFDATVLPDGLYRFRLVARDQPSNLPGEVLEADETSGPVVIDHSPPRLLDVERQGTRITVTVEDALNPLRQAAVSVDAGDWRGSRAVDGLLDSRRETLVLTVPEDARLVLLRLTDAALNVVTYDLLRSNP